MKAKADLKTKRDSRFSIAGTSKDKDEQQDEAESPRVAPGEEGRPPPFSRGPDATLATGRTRVNEEDETRSKAHVKRNPRIGNLDRPGVE